MRTGADTHSRELTLRPKGSGRKGNKKVRTGCLTCKIRKVKCDETRPSCLRCTNTGRKCDGYPPLSPRPGAASQSSGDSIIVFSPPQPPPAAINLGSSMERHAFDYYRARSAAALSGGIADSFWPDLVVKLSLFQPAVRHAVLALSSLHEHANLEDGERQDNKSSHWTFALTEYNRAIGELRALKLGNDDGESTATLLLVCLLFVCIEFLTDNETASQLHICQGREILAELEATSPATPSMEMIREVLVPIYVRLSLSSYTCGSRPASVPLHMKLPTSTIPSAFSSLDQARRLLYQIVDDGLRFTTTGMTAAYACESDSAERRALQSTQEHLLSQLSRWRNAFAVLVLRSPSSASHQVESAPEWNMPLLYYHAAVIGISVALQRFETAYDHHTASFASIISLASSIAHARSVRQGPRDAFGFEAELIPALYWTATKCRHPLLRREALKILLRDEVAPRRENVWHASEAAAVAARVVEMEEGNMQPTVRLDGYPLPEQTPENLDLHLPLSTPPLISPQNLDELYPSAPDKLPEGVPALNDQGTPFSDPPFGVPEKCRVKNVLIGPKRTGGTWLTIFEDSEDGQSEWQIKKEFLRWRSS